MTFKFIIIINGGTGSNLSGNNRFLQAPEPKQKAKPAVPCSPSPGKVRKCALPPCNNL